MFRAAVVGWLLTLSTVWAEPLPLVGDVDWSLFREQIQHLLAAMKQLDAPLPEATVQAVSKLLEDKEPEAPGFAAREVQKLLDPHCLIGIHINPESRVKAARGEREARLVRDQPTLVLIRVHNEGGVTHPLSALSEHQLVPDKKDPDRWLELTVVNDKPFANKLTGQRIEYRLLKLTARQQGKREATLAFDVGQGTQDLGFRSEVPILFTVRRP